MKTDLVDTGIVIFDEPNPSAKVPIIVDENQGTLFIDEIPWLPLPDVDDIAFNHVDNKALQGLVSKEQTLSTQILNNNQAGGDRLQ